MRASERKTRITCKDYCPLWDDIDRDCDAYGEHHPSPRNCPHFRSHHKEMFAEEEIQNESK